MVAVAEEQSYRSHTYRGSEISYHLVGIAVAIEIAGGNADGEVTRGEADRTLEGAISVAEQQRNAAVIGGEGAKVRDDEIEVPIVIEVGCDQAFGLVTGGEGLGRTKPTTAVAKKNLDVCTNFV